MIRITNHKGTFACPAWTPEDDAVIYEHFVSDPKRCAELLAHRNIVWQSIKSRAFRLGVRKPRPWSRTENLLKTSNRRWRPGEFAIAAGCSRKAASNWLRRNPQYLRGSYTVRGTIDASAIAKSVRVAIEIEKCNMRLSILIRDVGYEISISSATRNTAGIVGVYGKSAMLSDIVEDIAFHIEQREPKRHQVEMTGVAA